MEMTKEQQFTDLSIPKTLVKFIVPSVLGQLVFLILNLTDTFFVGRTGDNSQISAMTITFPLVMMMQFIAAVFGVGANANMASELGRGDRKRARQYSVFAIISAILMVVFYSLFMLAGETAVLRFLGADNTSIDYCKGYLFWVLHVGGIPAVLVQTFSQLYMAEGESNVSATGVSIAGIANIILDPICIFVFHMGVVGAALATCLGNILAVCYDLVILYQKRKSTVVCIDPREYRLRDGICTKTLAIGIPAGLVFLFNCICDFTRNAMLGRLGNQVTLAAWGVVQKIGNAFMQICVGIAQGIRAVVSYNYASGNRKRAKGIISATMLVMGVYTLGSVLLVRLFPGAFVGMFLTEKNASAMAAVFLQRWIFCVIGIGFVELYNSVFQAYGKWKISMANTIINRGFLLTPVMLLLTFMYGIDGMLVSQPITEIGTAVVLTILYFRVLERKN